MIRHWNWWPAWVWIIGHAVALFSIYVLETNWIGVMVGAVVSGVYFAYAWRDKVAINVARTYKEAERRGLLPLQTGDRLVRTPDGQVEVVRRGVAR
jgi:hypothetical protein